MSVVANEINKKVEFKNNLASNLEFLRIKNKITIKEITEHLNNKYCLEITPKLYRRWESEKLSFPLYIFEALSNYYDVEVNDLINRDLRLEALKSL